MRDTAQGHLAAADVVGTGAERFVHMLLKHEHHSFVLPMMAVALFVKFGDHQPTPLLGRQVLGGPADRHGDEAAVVDLEELLQRELGEELGKGVIPAAVARETLSSHFPSHRRHLP